MELASYRSTPEREMLGHFLSEQRAKLLVKASGLEPSGYRVCPSPSTMSIGGLLKHLTLVEDWWFDYRFNGEDEREPWASIDWDEDPDWEWRTAADDDPTELVANYRAACDRSDAIIAAAASLDQVSVRSDEEGPWTLRWIVLHMIEETARHVGHIDIIRETIDGVVGE